MAYTSQKKRRELFEPDRRYLLITTKQIAPLRPDKREHRILDHPAGRKGKGKHVELVVDFNDEELLGYCAFQFDTEETMSSRDAEVTYWCVSPDHPCLLCFPLLSSLPSSFYALLYGCSGPGRVEGRY